MRARALECVARPDAAPAVLHKDVIMLFVTSLIALRVVGLAPRTTLACSMALQHLEVGAAVVDDDEGVWK